MLKSLDRPPYDISFWQDSCSYPCYTGNEVGCNKNCYIPGLGSGNSPCQDYLCCDYDGPYMVAQESYRTGKYPTNLAHTDIIM